MKGNLIKFASESLGISLFEGQRRVLSNWQSSQKQRLLMACGRRGGKTTLGVVAAIYNATVETYQMPIPGSTRYILVVATRLDRAREFIKTCRTILRQAPDEDLAALVDVEHSTQDEIVFSGGEVILKAMPCSARAARGDAVSLVVMDELASFVTTDEGFAAGKQVFDALMPSLAQFGDRGYAMFLSSPLYSTGIFWDLYQAGSSGMAPNLHVEQRTTFELNPSITRESLAYEEQGDPDYFRREYLAEFIEGSGSFLSATAIQACVQSGREELPPQPGVAYAMSCDPAFTGDYFTGALAHRTATGEIVLDVMRSWKGRTGTPLDSDEVAGEIAALCHRYGISEIVSDQFAAVPLANIFRRHGIVMRGEPWTNKTKADAFLTLRRAINTETLELLDHAQTISELITLETRPTPSGLARIQASGQHHDDHACALASVVFALSDKDWTAKTYGSKSVVGDAWVAYAAEQVKDAQPELPEITIREVRLGGW